MSTSASSQLPKITVICFRRVNGKLSISLASSESSSRTVLSEASSRDTPSRSLRVALMARTNNVTANDVFATVAVSDTHAAVIDRGSMMVGHGDNVRETCSSLTG